jgi:hypothetical protein
MTSTNLIWRRSGRCTNSDCVEIAKDGDDYLIRDSKAPATEPLRLPGTAWHAFVAAIKDGEFE